MNALAGNAHAYKAVGRGRSSGVAANGAAGAAPSAGMSSPPGSWEGVKPAAAAPNAVPPVNSRRNGIVSQKQQQLPHQSPPPVDHAKMAQIREAKHGLEKLKFILTFGENVFLTTEVRG